MGSSTERAPFALLRRSPGSSDAFIWWMVGAEVLCADGYLTDGISPSGTHGPEWIALFDTRNRTVEFPVR